MRYVDKVVDALIAAEAHKATKYISDRMVVRACRRLFRGCVPRCDSIDIVLTIGRPNYAERKFIKKCKAAGEPFPVRKVQLKHPSKRARSRRR